MHKNNRLQESLIYAKGDEQMLSRPPKNFKLSKNTENLFLFYQCVNEMTFDYSPDTYKAPTLNVRLLCREAYMTYKALQETNSLEKYYNKYLEPILEELKFSLTNDNVAKELLGERYSRVYALLDILKTDKTIFESTLRNLQNYLGDKKYYYKLTENISDLVNGNKNQLELIKLAGDWMAEVLALGYSKQHIYNVTSEFFEKQTILSGNQIQNYFEMFSFEKKKWECITIADKRIMAYIKGLERIIDSSQIEFTKMSMEELKKLIQREEYRSLNWLLEYYRSLSVIDKVELIKYTSIELDPYTAAEKTQKFMDFFVDIITNVDNEVKRIYPYNACLNYSKTRIKVQSSMQRRNRKYEQSYLPSVLRMLQSLRVSKKMFSELMSVLSYHGDAITQGLEDKYVVTMLWTSLEMLFSNGSDNGSKGQSVKEALVEIIQRTYIVKRLKYLHNDFVANIKAYDKELINKYSIDKFEVFVDILFEDNGSERVLEIQKTLECNPLLRTRIFELVEKNLKKGDKIKNLLDEHQRKIKWHIDRIYRTRNFLVHAGQNFWYEDMIVECLHNYVDFVVNYILVKTEAGEYIDDISDVIEEAKMDNDIHKKILCVNKTTEINRDNYKKLLFGPSDNVLKYYENHIV